MMISLTHYSSMSIDNHFLPLDPPPPITTSNHKLAIPVAPAAYLTIPLLIVRALPPLIIPLSPATSPSHSYSNSGP